MKVLLSSVSILVALCVLLVPLAKAKYAFDSNSYWVDAFTGKRSVGSLHSTLCKETKTEVPLNDDIYEYLPPFYTEIECVRGLDSSEQFCTEKNMACVQEYSDIFILKALQDNKSNKCWEFEKRKIPYGCSCMKPKYIENV